MATLIEVYQMQGDATLKNQVTAAIAKVAYYIIAAEAANAANHAARLTWAKSALLTPEAEANRIMWAVLQNTDIQGGDHTDTTVSYVTEICINQLAV